MTRKTNLDWYRERLSVIEQEFGAKWLTRKAYSARAGTSCHPIPRLWGQAKSMLGLAEASRALQLTSELADFFDLAGDLEATRGLPGYPEAITAQRLKSLHFEKDCYVARVAAMGIRSGYSVAFVPVSRMEGEQTPDLSMTRDGVMLQVECKQKDEYVEVSPALPAWTRLEERLAGLHDQLTSDYEVIVCTIGTLKESYVDDIARFAQSVITAGEDGEFSGGVPDCVLLIRRNPPRPPDVEGAWIPAWQNPSSATVSLRIGADGQPNYGPMLRNTLYVIDSHRLSQVLSSFNQARSQIFPSSAGVIFIGVDTSRIRWGDHDLYFRTLSESLQRQFSPTANSRIAAVVLTGGIATVEITPDRGWHRTLRYWRVIRNRHFPGAAELIIPGESPTPSA